jgi:hypothetical protein
LKGKEGRHMSADIKGIVVALNVVIIFVGYIIMQDPVMIYNTMFENSSIYESLIFFLIRASGFFTILIGWLSMLVAFCIPLKEITITKNEQKRIIDSIEKVEQIIK